MLTHALLQDAGVAHGFGLRDIPLRPDLLRPRQVHGTRVVDAAACRARPAPEADAVVSREPGVPVGVVTADCVPILLAARDGRAVAAVHAGWRGLAAGIVAQGVDALRREMEQGGAASGDAPGALLAAIGPHIGACCYEVDAPVLDALVARFGDLGDAARPSRPGHALLDLGALAVRDLVTQGLSPRHVGALGDVCTRCDAQRFHSHRRDGPRAGRLWHFVAAGPT